MGPFLRDGIKAFVGFSDEVRESSAGALSALCWLQAESMLRMPEAAISIGFERMLFAVCFALIVQLGIFVILPHTRQVVFSFYETSGRTIFSKNETFFWPTIVFSFLFFVSLPLIQQWMCCQTAFLTWLTYLLFQSVQLFVFLSIRR
jgi:hypothetical protein